MKCQDVSPSDPDFRGQLEQLKETMLRYGGLGLAANQVGLQKRMIVTHAEDEVRVWVNPRVVGYIGRWQESREGCLSLPGVYVPVKRNTEVIVESLDLETGAMFAEAYRGQLGHVLQHEVDHLDGKFFLDDLKPGVRDQIRASLRKRSR